MPGEERKEAAKASLRRNFRKFYCCYCHKVYFSITITTTISNSIGVSYGIGTCIASAIITIIVIVTLITITYFFGIFVTNLLNKQGDRNYMIYDLRNHGRY